MPKHTQVPLAEGMACRNGIDLASDLRLWECSGTWFGCEGHGRRSAQSDVRIESKADPEHNAVQAIARKDYRLLVMNGMMSRSRRPPGVVCFTPSAQAPRVLAAYAYGDVIDERGASFAQYAKTYNQLIVESPDYSDADLCRMADPEADRELDYDMLVRRPARVITRAPLSLHEAARHGTRADIQRFLHFDVNATDGSGMTPLAWAVARGNSEAITMLINAGADPWIGHTGQTDAVYWAALLGRVDDFNRLKVRRKKPFTTWPSAYLAAAVTGQSQIVDEMLAQPHERFRMDQIRRRLPTASVLEKVLADDPGQAESVLVEAIRKWGAPPADVVALTLRYGASPDAEVYATRTVLGEIAKGINPGSVELVDLLLKSGADPNKLSWIDRPIWIALRTTRIFSKNPELTSRALAIYHRLLQAGANLNLANGEGVPGIRTFLFPMRNDHDDLDAHAGTPAMLTALARDGLDLNAPWRGQRILGLVEKQAGAESELAVTLRRLGAEP